jgi:hypothetical protein
MRLGLGYLRQAHFHLAVMKKTSMAREDVNFFGCSYDSIMGNIIAPGRIML